MKKVGIILAVVFCLFSTTIVYASNPSVNSTLKSLDTTNTSVSTISNSVGNIVEKQTQTEQLVKMKDKEKSSLEDYQESYGPSYGLTAYILHIVQIYSIPFCFIGIAVSGIYQYVLGIRKLDTRDKGFAIMISIVTIFIIAQVLPLIFAIVVKGWRG